MTHYNDIKNILFVNGIPCEIQQVIGKDNQVFAIEVLEEEKDDMEIKAWIVKNLLSDKECKVYINKKAIKIKV